MCYFNIVKHIKCFYFDIKKFGDIMAEIQKHKMDDSYNIGKEIKKRNKNKQNNGKNKNLSNKKNKTSNNRNKGIFTRFRIFCNGVKSEFLRVHWPNKSDMVKYSIATVFFIIFCALFFYCIDIVFAFFQSLFN